MKIKTWSHSRLQVFEPCKFRAQLAYIDKIPEPPRPLPPGKTEHANDRGTRMHEAAERYVKGGVELLEELQHFAREFEKARELHKDGRCSLEGEWAFTREWAPTAWMSSDAWCRIKCDMVVDLGEDHMLVVDYKSGKRWGNELKHAEQMQLYTVGALCRHQNVRKVTTELWYLDLDEKATTTYTREQGLRYVKNFERRGDLLTACEEFPANPSKTTCRWCPYKPKDLGGSGHCTVGV